MKDQMLHSLIWRLVSPTAFLSLASWLFFFATRLYCLIKAHSIRGGLPFVSWFYLFLEGICLVPTALPYVLRILAFHKPTRVGKTLTGEDVPTVDILVCCCNEDVDTILNTVRAACVLDYPVDRFRVFVCDDGGSNEVKVAVEGLPYSNAYYHARKKGPVKDYKAGNLNAGFKFAKSIPYRPKGPEEASYTEGAEYYAGLDADMIPQPDWLRRMLPYFVEDPKVGLACPPQTFYDVPENDPLTQTMDGFSGITELFNDALGHADCLGSGYVTRTTAIEGVGGFPLESLSEDVCCSAIILGAGWKTVFVDEPLQHGSVPESFYAHVKQRTRWFIGHVQTAVMFKLRFFGDRGKHLNLVQKIVGLAFDLSQLSQIPLVLAYFSIPFALLNGYPLVVWSTYQDLRNLLMAAVVWLLCHWMHQGIIGIVASWGWRQYDVRMPSYQAELDQWLAPYAAISFVRTFILPERFGGKKAGFTATGSLSDSLKERDGHNRAPLHRRLYDSFITNWLLIHLVFILATVAGVALTIYRASKVPTESPGHLYARDADDKNINRIVYLIERIGWPPLIWLQYFSSAMSPILYVFFPPTTPSLNVSLVEDKKTGVLYPTVEAKRPKRSAFIVWRYFRPAVVMMHTAILIAVITKM